MIRDLHGRKEGKLMKYLCVDIGGSSMKYCLMSEKTEILDKGKTSLKEASSVSDMVSVIKRQYEEYGRPEGGIAISYCGELDASTGLLYNGGSYPFMASCNLKDILEKECQTKASIENDGNCAAIAELSSGSLKDCRNAFVLIVGTGLAGAVINDRTLYHGIHNYSGFLSFLAADLSKPFSLNNIAARITSANYLCRTYEQEKGLKDQIDGELFFKYIDKNDHTAKKILEQYAQNLANVIFNVQLLLDVEKISVGGGVSIQDTFQKELKKAYAKIYETTPLQYINPPKAELTFCTYHNDANLIGALIHHMEEMKQ